MFYKMMTFLNSKTNQELIVQNGGILIWKRSKNKYIIGEKSFKQLFPACKKVADDYDMVWRLYLGTHRRIFDFFLLSDSLLMIEHKLESWESCLCYGTGTCHFFKIPKQTAGSKPRIKSLEFWSKQSAKKDLKQMWNVLCRICYINTGYLTPKLGEVYYKPWEASYTSQKLASKNK